MRDIHRLNEQYPQDPDLARWSLQVREVYDQARAYPGPEPGLLETVRRARRVKQQLQYERQLWAICKPYLGSDAPMRVLCQRVERGQLREWPSAVNLRPADRLAGSPLLMDVRLFGNIESSPGGIA